jgi:hypothetical protein
MKNLLITLLLISTNVLAGLGPDIIILSSKATVFGQRLVSGEVSYIKNSGAYSHNTAPAVLMKQAKDDAIKNALEECSLTSKNITILSPWTIHKVVSCSDAVCYGTEYGKFLATALFECI